MKSKENLNMNYGKIRTYRSILAHIISIGIVSSTSSNICSKTLLMKNNYYYLFI